MDFDPPLLRKCWFLTGPTASGKSAAALWLADRIGAEIISLDSMAVYRGMDIGTAKPAPDDRQRIRHHLIDIADPHEEFSVAEFVRLSAAAAKDIMIRGKIPLFVGGTGLYLRSILRGLYTGPEPDWDYRREMEQLAVQLGPQWLLDQLAAVDPATAARLHLHDRRRMIRALEVHRQTGRAISDEQQHSARPLEDRPAVVVWLCPPRDWMKARIDLRVEQMLSAGWLEETRQLTERIPAPSRTACQALGYKELIGVIRGTTSLPEATGLIQTSTRQFAKRQLTWFRNLEECVPLPISGREPPAEIAEKIVDLTACRSL